MEKAKVIELKETILEDNNADAQVLRQELKAQKTCLMNLMSSPGSGKTSTLLALKPYFEGKIKWGVMEADIDSDVDANTLIKAGIPSIQLHTGGMCHLDADMTRQGIRAFDRDELDFVVLENIGNLVEFFRGVAALVDNQAVVAVPLQTVQGVVTLIEALKHMGRVDDRIQIREGIQAGQVNLGSERDGLFCLLLLAGGGGVLKLLFNELLEHV